LRFNTLDAWLEWQVTLNPSEINLGLERIAVVLDRLEWRQRFKCPLVMVAGTNGKGSVVAMMESIALADGYSVACYTSPHIKKYNERIRIDGVCISDEALCDAFERVDQARGDVQLTYFEFGTLAAIDLFHRSELDIVIMEVGLGGRLDAVNIMQPDVSVITTVDIDHTDWLGEDREAIGYEKAGIFRSDVPVVCGDKNPPRSLLDYADKLQTSCLINGTDFSTQTKEQTWNLQSKRLEVDGLPLPSLIGDFQISNAAVAIMALHQISTQIPISELSMRRGLSQIQLNGRYQTIHRRPDVIVDVAHNVQAAESLAHQLELTKESNHFTYAVTAMLADKEVEAVIRKIAPHVDFWYCAGLGSEQRGMSSKRIASILERVVSGVKLHSVKTVSEACDLVFKAAKKDSRIIIFGSFVTVSEAMSYFEQLEGESR